MNTPTENPLLSNKNSLNHEKTKNKNTQSEKSCKSPIAVQGAMDVEISALLEAMGEYKEEVHGTFAFYLGEIDGTSVVVSRTDIGLANAAAATALLIQNYQPKLIINQGTAGGHDPNIRVFDTVIGTKVINIGSFRTEHRGAGQGMAPDAWIHMEPWIRDVNGEVVNYATFESDPQLVEITKTVADQYQYGKVVEGTVGSCDFWNREIDRIHWFHENYETSVEEMEAFAVAQIAHIFNVPFLSIRTVSNSEVTDDHIEDLELAGQYCAEFAVKVVKAIAAQHM